MAITHPDTHPQGDLPQRGSIRCKWRKLARALRVVGLVLVLGIVCAGLYLNRVGFPYPLKEQLLAKARAHGVAPQVSRFRLSLHRGLVAENVTLKADDPLRGSTFCAAAIELRPDPVALMQFRIEPRTLVVRDGRLLWRLHPTNLPEKTLELEDIQTELELAPAGRLNLKRAEANLAGAKLRLTGTLRHVSALREATSGLRRTAFQAELLESKLWQLAELLEQIKFDGAPVVHLELTGDVRELESFVGLLTVAVQVAQTPWCTLSNATLSLRVNSLTNASVRPLATLRVRASRAATEWGSATDVNIRIDWTTATEQSGVLIADVDLHAGAIATAQTEASQLEFTAQWQHFATNPMPINASSVLNLRDVKTRFGNAESLSAYLQFATTSVSGPAARELEPVLWSRLAPIKLRGNIQLGGVNLPRLPVKACGWDFDWRMPNLVASNIWAQFDTGTAHGRLDVDVVARRADFICSSEFDVRQIAPLLTENARRWLLRFDWETPPKIRGRGTVVLPEWTRVPDWRAEVQPTLQLKGELEVGPAAYRGLRVSSGRSHFFYTNMCWHLPDLQLTRPEGTLELSCISSDVTRDIHWCVKGNVDPMALWPVLDEAARRRLGLLSATQPAWINLKLWGGRAEKLPRAAIGQVLLTNFMFRAEHVSSFCTDLVLTNHALTFLNPTARRNDEFVRAEAAQIDFSSKKVYLTNAYGWADPMAVARAIGPKTARAITPYQFLSPLQAHVDGVVPFHGTAGTDLQFKLDGGPFRWWRFNLARLSGMVHWTDKRVRLTVLEADLYGGKLVGAAFFDFNPPEGAEFRFDTAFTNVNLQLLMQDISPRTNRLEGLLTGHLEVRHANSRDWGSWLGHGQVHLRDGYVWELPLFGVFSPVLDSIVPGLGRSRFADGTAQFTIANRIISYRELELRAPLLRMKLRGEVDFHEKVDARAEAELLRDTWLIGPLISAALSPLTKLFEYRLSGTLTEPTADPVYVPKFLLAPLHPMRVFRGMFLHGPNGTNAAPAAGNH